MATENALSLDDNAKSPGANEADRRHEWDSLLINFFKPDENRVDVLLERQLNLARNMSADDSSCATSTMAILKYHSLCIGQFMSIAASPDSGNVKEAEVAYKQANAFYSYRCDANMGQSNARTHSYKDPVTAKCDAILIVPFSGGATAMLQGISSSKEQEDLLKPFLLIQDPKPEELDASTGETSRQIEKTVGHSRKTKSNKSLQVPNNDSAHAQESRKYEYDLKGHFLTSYPDGKPTTQKNDTKPSKNTSGTDIQIPVLVAEYKKTSTSGISTAMNQMRIYQVSAVTFLSALGITGQPVFGLVANGTLGGITMAWKSDDVCAASIYHF
ncbi:hypothetical protein CY34DRAFT_527904 [Suillus luteus UH-Slu-Lm8-n1]|uniref:Uncharacterized protein n=1 Tax=Suillus luteus UH-Slu-Lm8-n1 TaxID=930992 RepID=A0A0D0ADV2_9AGAM|nr:hypothetical protein CY34DRAFT_527904 [Suillus luteus UH-Slu-Lm8-n1]